METKFASQDSILDKLSEKFHLSRFWEGEPGFYPPPPPCPPELEKSLPWIGLKPMILQTRYCALQKKNRWESEDQTKFRKNIMTSK